MSRKVKIKQIKSTIKRLESQKRTLEALGLRKIGIQSFRAFFNVFVPG